MNQTRMKPTIILLFLGVFVVLAATGSAAAQEQTDQAAIFSYHDNYKGPFKSKRIYMRGQGELWFLGKPFYSLKDIACREAAAALRGRGTWVGNLDDDGRCLGTNDESPEWTTGHFLNYLFETSRNKQEQERQNAETVVPTD